MKMDEHSTKHDLIRVICEACSTCFNAECPLCGGAKFYFWNNESGLCYSHTGTLIVHSDEEGHSLPVVRSAENDPRQMGPDIKMILDFIEEWVSESPIRKWKLTLDENGWQACVWFNRYKKICFETADINFETCILRSYSEIIKYNAVHLVS